MGTGKFEGSQVLSSSDLISNPRLSVQAPVEE